MCLAAQPVPDNVIPVVRPGLSPALRQYLELTQEQVEAIGRLNQQLQRFEADKARRMVQVQVEIGQETSRTPLDPMALGLRYVELEAIRRETEAESKRVAEAIQSVLTPAQKNKIGALQEALRLQSLACDALNSKLLSVTAPASGGSGMGFASFLLGGAIYSGGCAGVPVIRGGVFPTTPLVP